MLQQWITQLIHSLPSLSTPQLITRVSCIDYNSRSYTHNNIMSSDITNTQFSLLPDLLLVLDSLQAKDASLAIKQVRYNHIYMPYN